jgi:hypothetical protein
MTDPLPPIICKPDDLINVKRAAAVTGLSEKTVRRYFKRYRLGRQVTGSSPLGISLPALQMVVHGDFDALERLRAGNRHHPSVARYFDMLGIQV